MTLRRFLVGGNRKQKVEKTIVNAVVRKVFHFRLAFGANHVDGAFDEIAHHGLDVAADVSDLGELRCFDLDEWRPRQLREASRNLGFPHTSRTDEDDVVRRNFLADGLRRALPAPPVPQCDSDQFFCVRLADDIPVQLCNDVARREIRETCESVLCSG